MIITITYLIVNIKIKPGRPLSEFDLNHNSKWKSFTSKKEAELFLEQDLKTNGFKREDFRIMTEKEFLNFNKKYLDKLYKKL